MLDSKQRDHMGCDITPFSFVYVTYPPACMPRMTKMRNMSCAWKKTHELAGVSTFGCALNDCSQRQLLVCRSNPPPATGFLRYAVSCVQGWVPQPLNALHAVSNVESQRDQRHPHRISDDHLFPIRDELQFIIFDLQRSSWFTHPLRGRYTRHRSSPPMARLAGRGRIPYHAKPLKAGHGAGPRKDHGTTSGPPLGATPRGPSLITLITGRWIWLDCDPWQTHLWGLWGWVSQPPSSGLGSWSRPMQSSWCSFCPHEILLMVASESYL